MRPHMQLLLHTLYGAILLALLGCADGADGVSGYADTNSRSVFSDTTQPDSTDPGDQYTREIILLHDTTVPLQVGIQGELIIRARIIDYAAGSPASDAEVTYEIIENTDDVGTTGDASMSSQMSVSDEDGLASNTFRGGYIGDVSYLLQISSPGAEERFIEIIVSDTPKGSLEVNLDYVGPISLSSVKVRLMPKSYVCGSFNPTASFSGSLADKTVLDINNQPLFSGLGAGQHFTLVAIGKSPTGGLAAAGCKDGIFIVADQLTSATLTLNLLPLKPTGNYSVDNYFDFTETLDSLGTVGDVIQGIVQLFNDPGLFLIEQIKSLVSAFIGDVVTDLAFSLFEDALADVITDWVQNESPNWLQDFFTIGDDLTQIVNNLHLTSILQVSKLQNDYYFQGTQAWNGLVLTWKYGCDETAPDYETCGIYNVDLEQLTETQFPQDLIEGTFTGAIANYDKLFIDQHTIQLSYGKLILFVLNELILKTVTGQNTLQDAALQFVNCPGIASSFSSSILDGIGLTEAKLSSYCQSVILLLITPLESYISNLALDSQLRLSGQCTLLDDSADLIVDQLLEGQYQGMVEINQGAGPPFQGTFSGVRIDLQ